MKNRILVALIIVQSLLSVTSCNLPSASLQPTVEPTVEAIKIESIAFANNNLILEIGETETLSPVIEPSAAAGEPLNWSSSNTNIAKIENGVVTAAEAGSATIIAISKNGISAMCSVEVKKPSAYDSLSPFEKKFFDEFIKHLGDFKSPESIRILGFGGCPKENADFVFVILSATNSFGANIQETYGLALEDSEVWTKGYFMESIVKYNGIGQSDCCELTIAKLNDAIDEYIHKLGQ